MCDCLDNTNTNFEDVECVSPNPCTDLYDARCIIYTGVDLLCNDQTVIEQNNTLQEALTGIITFFCQEIESVIENQTSFVEGPPCTTNCPDCDDFTTTIIPGGNVKMHASGICDLERSRMNQTVFVDPFLGNDLTGEYQNFNKPFQTINAAQAALVAQLALSGLKGVIYLFPGTYFSETIIFEPFVEIEYHMPSGVILDGVRFRDSGVISPFVASITGEPAIQGSFFNTGFVQMDNASAAGSTFYLEYDSFSKTGSFGWGVIFSQQTNGTPNNITIKGRKTYHQDLSGSIVHTFAFRGDCNYNVILEESPIFIGAGEAGVFRARSGSGIKGVMKGNIQCPGFETTSSCVSLEDNAEGSVTYIKTGKAFGTSINGVFRCWGEVGRVFWEGDIITSGISRCIDTRGSLSVAAPSKVHFKGKCVNTDALPTSSFNIASQTADTELTVEGYIASMTQN